MEMYRSQYLFAAFLIFLVIFTSCSSSRVTVYPPNSVLELSDFETFDFFQLDASGDTSNAFTQNIAYFKSMVVKEMEDRGLKQDSNNPDLKINMGLNVEEKTQTRQTSLTDPGEWNYIGQRNYKWESKTVEVGKYKEGSLIMHLVNAEDNRAVWVGIIEGVLPQNPNRRQNSMEKAVAALFDKIDQSGE